MRVAIALTALGAALGAGIVSAGASGAGSPCQTLIRGTSASEVLKAQAASTRLLGLAGHDRLTGGPAADCLDGGPGNDRLAGLAGADRLDGASGKDVLSGGDGRDVLTGGPGADRLTGGGGADRLRDVPERYEAAELAAVRNRFGAGPGPDRVDAANGRRDVVNCGSGRDRVIADRDDRLIGCERKRFLRSPLPAVGPRTGGRRQTFMVRFRAIEEVASTGELFSIAVTGRRGCGRLVSNSLGIRYRPGATVRYRIDPFGRGGRAARRWCRGRYRGTVDFLRLPDGCDVGAGKRAPACAQDVRVGRFSFRVR